MKCKTIQVTITETQNGFIINAYNQSNYPSPCPGYSSSYIAKTFDEAMKIAKKLNNDFKKAA